MERLISFDDVIGHDWLVNYFKEQINRETLPHFIILEGAEGLGKTTLADIIALELVYGSADSEAKFRAYENVVKRKVSNDYIKKFELSVDGGKDIAREVRAEMNATFALNRKKVIICDECHNLSDAAQDVFLAETEYISDKVYIIMLTTEIDRLKPSLRSRAVPIHLRPLKHSDMLKVLKRDVAKRGLVVQNEDITLGMIAEWAECKPRTGLNILNAFGTSQTVSAQSVQELIGFMDIRDIVPLLASLSGSMTFGLSYISEMLVDSSLIGLVTETIRVKSGESSYKLKMSDVRFVRDQLAQVTVDQLVTFLYGITRHQRLTRVDIINAYINAHSNRSIISQPDTSAELDVEAGQKASIKVTEDVVSVKRAPTFDELFDFGDIVEGE